jgi:hypothetical protein
LAVCGAFIAEFPWAGQRTILPQRASSHRAAKMDACVRGGALFGPTDRVGLELWANAAEAKVEGLEGVAANGNGGRGYLLDQMGERCGINP